MEQAKTTGLASQPPLPERYAQALRALKDVARAAINATAGGRAPQAEVLQEARERKHRYSEEARSIVRVLMQSSDQGLTILNLDECRLAAELVKIQTLEKKDAQ